MRLCNSKSYNRLKILLILHSGVMLINVCYLNEFQIEVRIYDMIVAKISSYFSGLYDKFDQLQPHHLIIFKESSLITYINFIYCLLIVRLNIKIVIDEKYWTVHYKIDL